VTSQPTIVAYISGHGYGHGARTGLVLREVQKLAPAVRIVVRSTTPDWLYPRTATCVRTTVDVGVIQIDSLSPLIDETVTRAYAFEQERPALVALERDALAPLDPVLVLSDIPPLAFDVAVELGVPSVAIGNFSWDWIYRHLGSDRPEVDEIVERIRKSEARASVLLRLPLHDEMAAFPRIEDVPLVAHISHADRSETRRRIMAAARGESLEAHAPPPPSTSSRGADGEHIALLSFGGMGIQRLDLMALARTPEVTFVLSSPPTSRIPDNVLVVTDETLPYHDLLAACDVVVMKPGYGTVADCLANRVPMVYATRPGFQEEGILIEAMHREGRAAWVSTDDLFAGTLGPAIRAALALSDPWCEISEGGAEIIARRVLRTANIEA